jgi:hypothetical protein
MAIETWYDLAIRELWDVNEPAHELVRDATESACETPDEDEEE